MIGKFIDKYVNFKGRAGRKQYILRTILIYLLGTVAFSLYELLAVNLPKNAIIKFLFGISGIIIYLFLFIVSLTILVRRWHDLNCATSIGVLIGILDAAAGIAQVLKDDRTATLILMILFIPNCITILKKGTVGDNKYGPDPLQENKAGAIQTGKDNADEEIVADEYRNRTMDVTKPIEKFDIDSDVQDNIIQTAAENKRQNAKITLHDLPKLKKLLDDGIIAQAEFDAAKKKILG